MNRRSFIAYLFALPLAILAGFGIKRLPAVRRPALGIDPFAFPRARARGGQWPPKGWQSLDGWQTASAKPPAMKASLLNAANEKA